MPKLICSVYIATSLDGYIAREDGALDWLPQPGDSDEDYGYQDFFDSVDALVMGRNTFDMVQSFGEWPYGDKRVIVLTSRAIENVPDTVEQVTLDAEELANTLAQQGLKKIYIDGANIIQQFLHAGLVDDIIVTRVPVLLGGGKALFGPLENDISLEHISTTSYDTGLVQSHYRIRH